MWGDLLQLIGLLALLHWGGKLTVAAVDRRQDRADRTMRLRRLDEQRVDGGEPACAWPVAPRDEPEVRGLRRSGAL